MRYPQPALWTFIRVHVRHAFYIALRALVPILPLKTSVALRGMRTRAVRKHWFFISYSKNQVGGHIVCPSSLSRVQKRSHIGRARFLYILPSDNDEIACDRWYRHWWGLPWLQIQSFTFLVGPIPSISVDLYPADNISDSAFLIQKKTYFFELSDVVRCVAAFTTLICFALHRHNSVNESFLIWSS